MLKAIVTLCAVSGPCDRLVLPERFSSPVTCDQHAQAYAAYLNVAGRRITVRCEPGRHRIEVTK